MDATEEYIIPITITIYRSSYSLSNLYIQVEVCFQLKCSIKETRQCMLLVSDSLQLLHVYINPKVSTARRHLPQLLTRLYLQWALALCRADRLFTAENKEKRDWNSDGALLVLNHNHEICAQTKHPWTLMREGEKCRCAVTPAIVQN